MSSMPGMAGMAMPTDTGTASSSAGYTLRLATTSAAPNTATVLRFAITDPQGMPLTHYEVDQTKKLHLYLIRTDLTGYQHLHPTLAADGSWSVPVTFAQPGDYRVVADFTVATSSGPAAHVLGAPLTVTGTWAKQPLPAPAAATTVDGYTVNVAGTVTAGTASPLVMRITRDGKPVTDLRPYLGVWAHLSAFRAQTLAFTHLHPTQQPMSGMAMDSPQLLQFKAELPTSGNYRVFIQFQTGGSLHTAAVTLAAR